MYEAIEREILQQVAPELEAEGYDVFLYPRKPLAPAFLGNFPPDAIAMRSDGNLVVEVLRRSPAAREKLERLSALLEGQDKWSLRVFWIDPGTDQGSPEVQSVDAMRTHIAKVREIAAAGHAEAAMLLAWATFEALGRASLATQFDRPQTPGRLVEVLAHEGVLTPDEADRMRAFATMRNKFAHGELQLRVSPADIDSIVVVLETMLQQVPLERDKLPT